MQNSYLALRDILETAELTEFQTFDLLQCLIMNLGVICWDTGMGKSYLAAAIMRAYLNQARNRKFIYVVKTKQLLQTPAEIKELTGLNVISCSGVEEDVVNTFMQSNFLKADVLIISHSLLMNPKFMNFFYSFKDEYFGIIIDEIHELSNFTESFSAGMARAMLRNYKVRFGLTATPVTSDKAQIVKLAHMVTWKQFPDVNGTISEVKAMKNIHDVFGDLFKFRTRASEGILSAHIPVVRRVPAMDYQIGASGYHNMFKLTKGTGAVNQAEEVYKISQERGDKSRGLVYTEFRDSMDWLSKYLINKGLVVRCINGDTKDAVIAEYLAEHRQGKVDILITTITTALNMDSDYIIFYEYTTEIKQMLGRSHRGLNPKVLWMYFIFTLNTGEEEFFMKNIYKLSFWIHEVFRQDYSSFIKVGKELMGGDSYDGQH